MNRNHSHPADVIDLAALSRPARRVVDLFDQLANGQPPEAGALDDALSDLAAVHHPGGQIGNDITLLASGGVGASRQGVLDAVERLRRIGTVKSDAGMKPKRSETHRKGRQSQGNKGQLRIPGMDHGTSGES